MSVLAIHHNPFQSHLSLNFKPMDNIFKELIHQIQLFCSALLKTSSSLHSPLKHTGIHTCASRPRLFRQPRQPAQACPFHAYAVPKTPGPTCHHDLYTEPLGPIRPLLFSSAKNAMLAMLHVGRMPSLLSLLKILRQKFQSRNSIS